MNQLDRELPVFLDESGSVRKHPAFVFNHISDLTIEPVNWLIQDYLPLDTIGFIYGAWGTYKSFIALDMLLCVAAGIPYHGQQVRQGAVFYICGEGHNGIAKRVQAWGIENGIEIDELPFYVSEVPAQLSSPDNVEAIYQAIKSLTDASQQLPVFIVVDTLARNLGGNASESVDVSLMFSHLIQYLRQPFKCVIAVIAHIGHSADSRMLGSYSLGAGADFSYLVKRPVQVANECILTCEKVKDEPLASSIGFTTTSHELGVADEHGNPITSLALSVSDKPIQVRGEKSKSKNSRNHRVVISALHNAIQHGESFTVTPRQQRTMLDKQRDDAVTPSVPVRAVTRATFREHAYKESIFSSFRDRNENETEEIHRRRVNDAKRKKFDRYIEVLLENKRIFSAIINNEELFWPATTVNPLNEGGQDI
jgi:hypothetical protein